MILEASPWCQPIWELCTNWSYTLKTPPSHCLWNLLPENRQEVWVFWAWASHSPCVAPWSKFYIFLHHNLMSVDRLYCTWMSGPKCASVTPSAKFSPPMEIYFGSSSFFVHTPFSLKNNRNYHSLLSLISIVLSFLSLRNEGKLEGHLTFKQKQTVFLDCCFESESYTDMISAFLSGIWERKQKI